MKEIVLLIGLMAMFSGCVSDNDSIWTEARKGVRDMLMESKTDSEIASFSSVKDFTLAEQWSDERASSIKDMDARSAFNALSASKGDVSSVERDMLIEIILEDSSPVIAASTLEESSISLSNSEREALLLRLDVKQAARLRDLEDRGISEAEFDAIRSAGLQ